MKKIALSFFCFCFSNPLQMVAQENTSIHSYAADALNRLYILGLQYINDGDLNQAEVSFRSILAFPYRDKDWKIIRYYKGKAYYYLGDIYFLRKYYARCIENYQVVVQDYGEIEEYVNAFYKLGRSFILANNEKKGIEVLNDFNYHYGAHTSQSDTCLYWIARGYLGLENYTKALKILHQILRDYPNSPMGYEVRNLIIEIDKLESDPLNTVEKTQLHHLIDKIQQQEEALLKKRQLLKTMQNLLTLKEQLLLIKERKLELLKTIRKKRIYTFQKRNLYKQYK